MTNTCGVVREYTKFEYKEYFQNNGNIEGLKYIFNLYNLQNKSIFSEGYYIDNKLEGLHNYYSDGDVLHSAYFSNATLIKWIK